MSRANLILHVHGLVEQCLLWQMLWMHGQDGNGNTLLCHREEYSPPSSMQAVFVAIVCALPTVPLQLAYEDLWRQLSPADRFGELACVCCCVQMKATSRLHATLLQEYSQVLRNLGKPVSWSFNTRNCWQCWQCPVWIWTGPSAVEMLCSCTNSCCIAQIVYTYHPVMLSGMC